jgi:hypothetical protein
MKRLRMATNSGLRPARCALMLPVLLIAAAAAPPSNPSAIGAAVDGAIERLKPGEFLWAPAIAPAGPVTVVVSLKTQRAYAYRNGVPIGVATVSTGKPGHATPTGIFTILQKAVKHNSNRYSDAPMPFMERLTWSGIAMHAGNLPGYPASHGCVRLPLAFAKLLYGVTSLGLTVVITDDPAVPEIAPAPGILGPGDVNKGDVPEGYSWHPDRSKTGPVSIVVSGRDRRLVVLRNGVVIGSSSIIIDGGVTETTAFTLQSVDGAGFHWLRLSLPGQLKAEPSQLTSAERARGHLPAAFRAALVGVLQPGTTLLVTRDTLKSSGTGQRLTVISTDTGKQ